MQLSFAHRAFEPEQEAVVEVARVIQPVLVKNQRVGHRAQLKQPVPVGRVARQARDLKPEHDPGAAHPDLGHQPLEPLAIGGRGAGVALVAVDHHDPLGSQPSATARWRSAYWR